MSMTIVNQNQNHLRNLSLASCVLLPAAWLCYTKANASRAQSATKRDHELGRIAASGNLKHVQFFLERYYGSKLSSFSIFGPQKDLSVRYYGYCRSKLSSFTIFGHLKDLGRSLQIILTLAATKGHLEVVHFALAQGADMNKADNDGLTPLHDAARNGHLDVAKLLLCVGANLNARDGNGQLPIDIAANEDIRQAIQEEMTLRDAGLKRI